MASKLQNFLDGEGRLIQWPAKYTLQCEAMEVFADKFVFGIGYTEKQVNALLNRWHTFGDPALLRRMLADSGYLSRTPSGSRYVRVERAGEKAERVRAIPISRLAELEAELKDYREANGEQLNDFQRYILDSMYQFGIPELPFTPTTIILAAIPHPMCSVIELEYKGSVTRASAVCNSGVPGFEARLSEWADGFYSYAPTGVLPLKRLAVKSGLAAYGRNNITYVDGLGSSVALLSYFSDCPAPDGVWRDPVTADACAGCEACIAACPTGAILPDRFLIDNQRCLSYFNEGGDWEFPDWIPADAHNSIYDCVACQLCCPMNRGVETAETVRFTEAETEALLSGFPVNEMPEDFQKKTAAFELGRWGTDLSRNIRALLKL